MVDRQTALLGALIASAFIVTTAGTYFYRSFAIRRGILANPNFRSLHEHPIPRGGGIVFALVCIAAVAALATAVGLTGGLVRALLVGGTVATLFGFADDIVQIGAKTKFLVQGLLAAWILLCFPDQPPVAITMLPRLLNLALSWLGLVWLMNLYNFVDGIDGLAASGAVFISVAAMVVLFAGGHTGAALGIFALIAACCLGFLVFNWPRASIFMGDSGSLFLGFTFGVMAVATTGAGQISRWTWLVIFGYFAIDTTVTSVLRIFLTSKWYGAHRSHAYQNLARISGSHLRVVTQISLYEVLWLLPLAVWSALVPVYGLIAAALAVTPVVIWTVRYGPMLSSS